MTQRIGIYGGTFDPVHHGHLILARDAVEALRLDTLIFVPAAISPHKLAQAPGASGLDRLAMLEAAVAGEREFAVDDCELRREGPSYTIDTVEALQAGLPAPAEWFYLIGEDNVAKLDSWYRIEALRALVRFVVFRREASGADAGLRAVAGGAALPTLERRVDISATDIRIRVASGRSIRYLVPEAVSEIMAARSLYRPPV